MVHHFTRPQSRHRRRSASRRRNASRRRSLARSAAAAQQQQNPMATIQQQQQQSHLSNPARILPFSGIKKEIELRKDKKLAFLSLFDLFFRLLGVTLSDTTGCVYIRKISPDSVFYPKGNLENAMEVGDKIEAINGVSMIGKQHFEVARILRNIPVGETFTLRLISPIEKNESIPGNSHEQQTKMMQLEDGNKTIRFKGIGNETIISHNLMTSLNTMLENYLGLCDEELAAHLFHFAQQSETIEELCDKIENSSLSVLELPQEFLDEMWTALNDHQKPKSIGEKVPESSDLPDLPPKRPKWLDFFDVLLEN